MTEKLQQAIKEEIAQLPPEGQEAIGAVDWVKITEEIGQELLLDEDEIEDFQLETLLFLIGATDPEFYPVNIENHVNTTKEKAEQIAEQAFQKIFTPIRNILVENVKKNVKDKDLSPGQTLNFILSGGDYSALIAPSISPSTLQGEGRGEVHPVPPSLQEIKDKLTIKQ